MRRYGTRLDYGPGTGRKTQWRDDDPARRSPSSSRFMLSRRASHGYSAESERSDSRARGPEVERAGRANRAGLLHCLPENKCSKVKSDRRKRFGTSLRIPSSEPPWLCLSVAYGLPEEHRRADQRKSPNAGNVRAQGNHGTGESRHASETESGRQGAYARAGPSASALGGGGAQTIECTRVDVWSERW